ncbi:MAG: response regulator, partial [Candidatus Obscuribacterales bacterium]|nr:response regulator [Candidatus Obscuribacterales bacterium]
KHQAKILIVESDAVLARKFAELLQFGDDVVDMVDSGAQAIGKLNQQHYDCLVISMHLADLSGWQLAEMVQKINKLAEVPIIIYSDHPLSDEEHQRVEKLSRTNLVKDVDSPERLLHETTLFLHRVEASLPEAKRKMLNQAMAQDNNLIGRKIMIVDDDERNKAALVSILSKFKMQLSYASNGNEALEVLKANPDQDLILMDIMMPYMDGYEAMRQIRLQNRFQHLPIIAVTAKAMTGDRRKCLEAGASDYITKPVDRSQLLSLLRVWLQKR